MSDFSISIVPKLSSYPDNKAKAEEILAWLVSMDVVKPTLSDCTLSSDNGYAISEGARRVTNLQNELTFQLAVNGLKITTNRQFFHTAGNGMDECLCPNCKENIASEDWSFFDDWDEEKSNDLTCPLCNVATDIHQFSFSPEWGFSNLGFTFWNWPDFTDEFISEFRQKLGCEISMVFAHY